MKTSKIDRLILSNFRSYSDFSVDLDNADNIVICGNNGVGKTNLLEAICQFGSLSSFSPIFRKAKLSDMGNVKIDNLDKWQVFCSIRNDDVNYNLSVQYKYPLKNKNKLSDNLEREASDLDFDGDFQKESAEKLLFINGKKISDKSNIFDYVRMVWLTPFMDRIFTDASSDRRKFFDGLIGSFNPLYFGMLNDYNNALRQRSKLLKTSVKDLSWLDAIESNLAGLGVAIAVARLEFVESINKLLSVSFDGFPKILLRIDGVIENKLIENISALEVEMFFKDLLLKNRSDFEKSSFAFSPGVHRSDFYAFHIVNDIPVSLCSTGEQKLSLLSVIMAYSKMIKLVFNIPPIVLIDEAPAHIDSDKRDLFFAELQKLGSQTFFTGTNKEYFNFLDKFNTKILELSK